MYVNRKKPKRNYSRLLILAALILLCAAGGYFYAMRGGDEVKAEKVVGAAAQAAQKPFSAETPPQQSTDKQKALPYEIKTEEPKAAPTGEISLFIKKSEFRLYVLQGGQIINSYGCALGKNRGQKEKSGDMKTPTGTFPIEEICDASYWTHDFGDGKGEIKGAYGPWFLSLDTTNLSKGKWDGIGIHGTHDPASIGTLVSEGCIRLRNDDITALKEIAKVGTLVTIEE